MLPSGMGQLDLRSNHAQSPSLKTLHSDTETNCSRHCSHKRKVFRRFFLRSRPSNNKKLFLGVKLHGEAPENIEKPVFFLRVGSRRGLSRNSRRNTCWQRLCCCQLFLQPVLPVLN